MEVISRIIIDIHSDGTVKINQQNDLNKSEIKFDVSEEYCTSESWTKYNLISFSKNGEIYKELQKMLPNQDINVEINNVSFKGKIDNKSGARITSLSALYSFAKNNKLDLTKGRLVELNLNKKERLIKLNLK